MKTPDLMYEVGGGIVIVAVVFFESGLCWTFVLVATMVVLILFLGTLFNWGRGYDGPKGG